MKSLHFAMITQSVMHFGNLLDVLPDLQTLVLHVIQTANGLILPLCNPEVVPQLQNLSIAHLASDEDTFNIVQQFVDARMTSESKLSLFQFTTPGLGPGLAHTDEPAVEMLNQVPGVQIMLDTPVY
jgi:hypothetical protein